MFIGLHGPDNGHRPMLRGKSEVRMPARVIPLHLADFVFPDPSPYAGQQGVVMGYAVRHDRGVVIVDTGIGFGNSDIEAWYRPRSWQILEVLADHTIMPRDVVAVVNSHLHFDHSGQNVSFPGVPIYVQTREWDVAHNEDYTVLDWVDFRGGNYEQVDGEHEILPGLRLIATPGHTPGHQSVIVEGDAGICVIAGQAVYSRGEWDGLPGAREGHSSAWNPDEYKRSAQRLSSLNPRRVYFGHDLHPWDSPADRETGLRQGNAEAD